MNRRVFLAQALGLVPARIAESRFARIRQLVSGGPDIRIALDRSRVLADISSDFIGLGYETSSVAQQGLLSDRNSVYVQLVRTVGAHGVLRIGGNTSDFAAYSASGRVASVPEKQGGSLLNDVVLRDLGGFLQETGWQLIWGLNLGKSGLENAILEAKAVTAVAKNHLFAFEIGNEPDLFANHEVHRRSGYSYEDYLREYRTYRDSLRKVIPNLSLAGPDVASATDWVARFANDEGKNVKLLTHHYYREGQKPTSTIDKLLHSDPKLAPMAAKLKSASQLSGLPYRICETNSFSGGGKPGVSDTFAAALWVLDFMFILASAGCAGVNLETGVNQLGFISSYSPIADDEQGHYWAAPEYYGMLAFAQSVPGQLIETAVDSTDEAIKAYAVEQSKDRIVLTIINKRPSGDGTIVIDNDKSMFFKKASLLRLLAPSLDSNAGVNLGGATVSQTGSWSPTRTEEIPVIGRGLKVHVPAASAALVTLYF